MMQINIYIMPITSKEVLKKKLPICRCGATMISDGIQETISGRYEFFICLNCDSEARKRVEVLKEDDNLE